MSLDILFVNPSAQAGIYQGLADSLTAIEPPLWVRLLSSYCERKGIKTEIVDANALSYDAKTVATALHDERNVYRAVPRLIVIVAQGHQPSASTQTMPSVIEVSQAIKEATPDIPILIVGGHPAALPERTLGETGADAICTGEGPVTIIGLFEAIKSGIDPMISYGNVPGLCHKIDNEIFSSKHALNLQILSEIPGGMWEKLPMERYRAHNWACFGEESRQPYASIYTTLGCPYFCSFCNIQNPFREGDKLTLKGKANSYRMWHPTHVVDEIQLLVERYGVRHLKIADEMFVLNRNHVLNICDQIIERGLGDKLNSWAYCRVDTVREDLLDRMRRAGIRWLGFGIEAASGKVRDGVDKGFAQEQIFKALDMTRRAGINIAANFIFGLPEDDAETMQATLDLAMEINPEWANFYCAMAYPGSALYDQAVREGWPLPETWSGYSQHSFETFPLATKYLTSAQVLAFRDAAFEKFYHSPSYQSHVLTKFGAKAVVEVQEMVRVPLKRRLLGN